MPVKSTRFKTQTIFDGEITGLNEREKNVLKKAGIGGDVPKNVLIAPAGLTKTELVGVGTNGQENIEIGDNLTLANGKLSASGEDKNTFYNTIAKFGSKWDADDSIFDEYDIVALLTNNSKLLPLCCNVDFDGNTNAYYLEFENDETKMSMTRYIAKPGGELTQNKFVLQLQTYSHFLTLTSSTATFYFTYQNTSEDKLNTLDILKTALAGKLLLCNGHADYGIAEYASGEGGNIVVGIFNASTHASSKIIIDSTYTITDKVSPIE